MIASERAAGSRLVVTTKAAKPIPIGNDHIMHWQAMHENNELVRAIFGSSSTSRGAAHVPPRPNRAP
jgi:hypothetical protein